MPKLSTISIFYNETKKYLVDYGSLKQRIWWLTTRTKTICVLYSDDDLMSYIQYRDDLMEIAGIRGIDWDYRLNKKNLSILEIKLSKKHESLISYFLLKWKCQ